MPMINASRAVKSQVVFVIFQSSGDLVYLRVRTGHGNPGKSWNLEFYFPGLESHGISIRVMESHGKLVQFG